MLWLAFSPDGARLAVATIPNVIRLWDLSGIRGELRAIGLDWRPSPPPAGPGKPPPPLSVEILPFSPPPPLSAEEARKERGLCALKVLPASPPGKR